MRFLCHVCEDSVWVWCIISAWYIYMCVSPDVGVQVTWMNVGGDFPMSIPHTVYIVPERSFLHPAPLLPRLPVRVMDPTTNLSTQHGLCELVLGLILHCRIWHPLYVPEDASAHNLCDMTVYLYVQ